MDIIPEPKRYNLVLDSQILVAAIECARLMNLTFNLNLVPIRGFGESVERGGMMHHILEPYYKGLRDGLSEVLAMEIGDAAGNLYYTGDPNNPKEFPGCQSLDAEMAQRVIDVFHEYVEFWSREPQVIPVEIEEIRGKQIYEDDTLRIIYKCKTDLTTDTSGGIIPWNHKTEKRRFPLLSLNNQFMGECVVHGTSQIMINTLGFQTSLKPEEKFRRQLVPYSKDRLAEWLESVVYWAYQIIEYKESGHYPHRMTMGSCDKYGGCRFKSVCESDRSIREDEIKRLFKVGEPWNMGEDE